MSSSPTRSVPQDERAARRSLAISSPLRHLDTDAVDAAARSETRNREVYLPPISVYRWWARRTEAVNGAILDAVSKDNHGPLLVVDPFAGGGIIPLAAARRGHRVYAQDLNPWAVRGLTAMLALPEAARLAAAAERLHELIRPTLRQAYGTQLADKTPATVSHTFRVPQSSCSACQEIGLLYPHAMISLRVRKERGRPETMLACPAGHLFEGRVDRDQACPTCGRYTNPAAHYSEQRIVRCCYCGYQERLEDRARNGWEWKMVLVERTAGRYRELAEPTTHELEIGADRSWSPMRDLGRIPEGQETRVLHRHGFSRWQDLYPARQRTVIERLLNLASEATDDEDVLHALEMAVLGTAEMAGYLSRWDRWYLKSYESMAGHRFNFTTFTAEPNVWGAPATGRGTVMRRLQGVIKASRWMHARVGRGLRVEGPLDSDQDRGPLPPSSVDIRVVEGSSERILLPTGAADLVLTDPPYHDDVQYGELSLPFRAWAQLATDPLKDEALVNSATGGQNPGQDYRELLTRLFAESRRILDASGHLIFSYANRDPEAWSSLFAALNRAGFKACGYQLVQIGRAHV